MLIFAYNTSIGMDFLDDYSFNEFDYCNEY